jgi:hypothetical protein
MIRPTCKSRLQVLCLAWAVCAGALASFSSCAFDPGIIAWIDGEQIAVDEFMSCLHYKHRAETYAQFASYGAADRTDFWTRRLSGQRPIDYARDRTMKDLVSTKVQQILLKRDGIQPDITYGMFQKKLADENARRQRAVANHEIIYGPVTWDESQYFDHILNDNISAWKNTIGPKRFPLSDNQVRQMYESTRESYTLPDAIRVQVIAVSYAVMPREKALQTLSGMRDNLRKGLSIEDVAKRKGSRVTTYETTFDESSIKGDELARPLQRQEALRLQTGDISEIIEEGDGCMILRCTERQSNRYQSFERMRDVVMRNHIDKQYNTLVDEMVRTARVRINRPVYLGIIIR